MSLVTFRASDITLPRHVVKLLRRAWYGCSRITEDDP